MAKLTWRDPYPGETCFGGGSGILMPFNPSRMRSCKPMSTPPGNENDTPMLGAMNGLEDAIRSLVIQSMERQGITPLNQSESTTGKPDDKN